MSNKKKLISVLLIVSLLLCAIEGIAYASTSWEYQPSPTIYSRSDWGARSPGSMNSRGTGNYLIFHHTAWNFNSTNINTTKQEIKDIQDEHMDGNGWSDIAYHYIIDPAGRIWAGRAANKEGAHTSSYNNNLGIVVLGDFEGFWGVGANSLTTASYNAMCSLSKYLMYKYSLDLPGAYCHKDFYDTACPGKNMEYYVWDDLRGHLSTYMQES